MEAIREILINILIVYSLASYVLGVIFEICMFAIQKARGQKIDMYDIATAIFFLVLSPIVLLFMIAFCVVRVFFKGRFDF